MHNQRTYAGIIFEIWEGQQSWFWFVIDPNCDRGAIGAALSETAAVRDACSSIDAMVVCVAPRPEIQPMSARCWEVSLASLERYLACFRDAAA